MVDQWYVSLVCINKFTQGLDSMWTNLQTF
jgi:hypothetical protein